ncbi:hypothetical protein FLJ01_04720 [Streptococcus agalactiae]
MTLTFGKPSITIRRLGVITSTYMMLGFIVCIRDSRNAEYAANQK